MREDWAGQVTLNTFPMNDMLTNYGRNAINRHIQKYKKSLNRANI